MKKRSFFYLARQEQEVWRYTLEKNPTKLEPGIHLKIPFFHRVQVIDLNETVIRMKKESVRYTRDNIAVHVHGYIACNVIDSFKILSDTKDNKLRTEAAVNDAVTSAIGKLTYNVIMNDRDKVTQLVDAALKSTTINWGVQCKHFVIERIELSRLYGDQVKQAEAKRLTGILFAQTVQDQVEILEKYCTNGDRNAAIEFLIELKNQEVLKAFAAKQTTK